MSSRYFLLLALLLAFVALLISSDVAATDLAQTSTQQNKVVDANVKGVEDGKYGGYPGQGSYNNGGGQGSYDNGAITMEEGAPGAAHMQVKLLKPNPTTK
uniref:Glycine-rich protein n=1 Tax=Cannabis sativa TaxID=3483 RepID=A0A803NVA1_CANSA